MKVLVVGDGAPLEALIGELRSRGEYEFAVVGASDDAVEQLGVTAVARPVEVSARIETIMSAVRGRSGEVAWDDPVWGVVDAVAASDAVVVAGGTCLDSRSSGPLAEGLLATRLATEFSKPVLLSGQALGTLLSDTDRTAVAEILSVATLAGLAGQASFDAVGDLGIPSGAIRRTLDDTAFVERPTPDGLETCLPDGVYALVDLTDLAVLAEGGAGHALAQLLSRAAELTGAELVLVNSTCDGAAAAATGVTTEHRLVDAAPVVVDALARRAALVIAGDSELCQAAVVAGVPVLAISADCVTDRVLTGVLGDFGLADAVLPAAALATGDAIELLERIVPGSAGHATAHLVARRRADAGTWWDELHSALTGGTAVPATFSDAPQAELLSEPSRRRVAALRAVQRATTRRSEDGAAVTRLDTAELLAAEARIVALEADLGQLAAERDATSAELAEARLALEAAHAVTVEVEHRVRSRNDAGSTSRLGQNRALAGASDAARAAKLRISRAWGPLRG